MHKFWNELGHLRHGMWQTRHTPGQVLIKPQDRRNRPTGWNVKRPAIRAWGQYHSRVLDRRVSHTGCCEGATAEKAVPFPSERPSIPTPFFVSFRFASFRFEGMALYLYLRPLLPLLLSDSRSSVDFLTSRAAASAPDAMDSNVESISLT